MISRDMEFAARIHNLLKQTRDTVLVAKLSLQIAGRLLGKRPRNLDDNRLFILSGC